MKTNGMRRRLARSADSASRVPSAWVSAPRRSDEDERAITTLRPPMRPMPEVTVPVIPLPIPMRSATRTFTTGEI